MRIVRTSEFYTIGINNMTLINKQLEQQSRDAVIAYLQDSGVRLEYARKDSEQWYTKLDCPAFDLSFYYYRIAHPKPWFRVALTKYGAGVADNSEKENEIEHMEIFIKWLTDRIYYSVE